MRKLLAGGTALAILLSAAALPARSQTQVGGFSIPGTPSTCPTSTVANYNYGALFTNQGALCVDLSLRGESQLAPAPAPSSPSISPP